MNVRNNRKYIMRTIIILHLALICTNLQAQDWEGIPIPADPGTNCVWQLQPQSDDFTYSHPAENSRLFDKWVDYYHDEWSGPGLTVWSREQIFVTNGLLQIPASRLLYEGEKKISTGCISSKTEVQYPVYVEARAKLSNSVLANGVWMLSRDCTQEIDILEAYGADFSAGSGTNQTWFSHRLHLSHHVFIRDPFQDYQPKDEGSWYCGETPWRNEFHRIGVHWKDPWNLDYYVDGKRVRSVSGKEIIDPENFTDGSGLNKPMVIIIDVEDQDWRSDHNVTPTDEELKDADAHTYKVDWIRIYKPVRTETAVSLAN